MAVKRVGSKSLSAGERVALKSARTSSANRTARRRIEAEKAISGSKGRSRGGKSP